MNPRRTFFWSGLLFLGLGPACSSWSDEPKAADSTDALVTHVQTEHIVSFQVDGNVCADKLHLWLRRDGDAKQLVLVPDGQRAPASLVGWVQLDQALAEDAPGDTTNVSSADVPVYVPATLPRARLASLLSAWQRWAQEAVLPWMVQRWGCRVVLALRHPLPLAYLRWHPGPKIRERGWQGRAWVCADAPAGPVWFRPNSLAYERFSDVRNDNRVRLQVRNLGASAVQARLRFTADAPLLSVNANQNQEVALTFPVTLADEVRESLTVLRDLMAEWALDATPHVTTLVAGWRDRVEFFPFGLAPPSLPEMFQGPDVEPDLALPVGLLVMSSPGPRHEPPEDDDFDDGERSWTGRWNFSQ